MGTKLGTWHPGCPQTRCAGLLALPFGVLLPHNPPCGSSGSCCSLLSGPEVGSRALAPR